MRYLLLCISLFFIPAWTLALNPHHRGAALVPVGDISLEEELVVDAALFHNKKEILKRVLQTLYYLESEDAQQLYQQNFRDAVPIESVRKSLHHFYLMLLLSPNVDTFTERLKSNFALYKSIGQDGKGTVRFTGYFQPSYEARRERTEAFRFPIFKKPIEFDTWSKPHPTRVELEGYSGETAKHRDLQGEELAWLRSRYDVFMVQLQGSAILEFPDGEKMSVGFAAGTEHPFRGISGSFLRKHRVAWHRLGEFFARQPTLLNDIMSRNNRFIFFKENPSPAAIGSLGVPVLAERSIATDKLKLPPGALAIIKTPMPQRKADGELELVNASRFVLNLDTGSALKGPGRVDIFMGTGEEARIKASSIFNTGQLYYLFLE